MVFQLGKVWTYKIRGQNQDRKVQYYNDKNASFNLQVADRRRKGNALIIDRDILVLAIVSIVVSRMTAAPPLKLLELVEDIRIPKGAGEAAIH